MKIPPEKKQIIIYPEDEKNLNAYLNTLSKDEIVEIKESFPELVSGNYETFIKKNWPFLLAIAYVILPDPIPFFIDDAGVSLIGIIAFAYNLWIYLPKKRREEIAENVMIEIAKGGEKTREYLALKAKARKVKKSYK